MRFSNVFLHLGDDMKQINIEDMPPQLTVEIMRGEFTAVRDKYKSLGIPAYVIDGVLSGVLSDVRQDGAREISQGYQSIIMKGDSDADTKNET